ncbi:MAG TPA: SH3 domain-containing protein [Phototrophicaceae bacterium]|nr:SH3 domain-containing protein [Phototrophicaceae bacterium]
MLRRFLLLVLCLLGIGSTVLAQEPTTCDGFLASRLVVGQTGRVTPGSSNNLRAEPSTEAERVGQIPGEGVFTVLEGPVCGENTAWWQVDYGGVVGWTVEGLDGEYWVEPVDTATGQPCISNLQVGEQGEVLNDAGGLYEQTDWHSPKVIDVAEGAIFEVVGGPLCNDSGDVWLEVSYNGLRGWFLESSSNFYYDVDDEVIMARRPLKPLQTAVPAVGTNPLLPAVPAPVDPQAITIKTAKQVTALQTLGDGYIRGFNWSPDESQLAVASSVDVRIYDVQQLNAAPRILSGFRGIVGETLYSPDGRLLAVSDAAGVVSLWDTERYEAIGQLEHDGAVEDFAFSQDGQQIAVAIKEFGIQIWDVSDTAQPIQGHLFEGRGGIVRFIADSRRVVNVDHYGSGVVILDAETGATQTLTQDLSLAPSGKSLDWYEISSDGRYVAIILHEMIGDFSMAHYFYLFGWNTETGEQVVIDRELPGQQSAGYIGGFDLLFDPTGDHLLVGTGDEQRFYGLQMELFGSMTVAGAGSAAYSPDGSLLAFGIGDGAIHLYSNYQFLDVLYGINGAVGRMKFSPSGTYLAAMGADNTVRVWEVASRQRLGTVQFERIHTAFFVLSPDETSIITNGGIVWDIAAGEQLQQQMYLSSPPQVLRSDGLLVSDEFFPDDPAPRKLVVKNLSTNEIVREIPIVKDDWIETVISKDGHLAASVGQRYDQDFVQVVDVDSGQISLELADYFEQVDSLLLSPDDRLLAVFDTRPVGESEEEHLLIWEIATGNLLAHYQLTDTSAFKAAYSPDGTAIAWLDIKADAAVNNVEWRLDVLELATGQAAVHTLPFDQSLNFIFSADGSLLVLGDRIGNIHLWDSQTGQEVALLQGHTGAISQLTLNRAGTRLYSAGEDGRLFIWGLGD